MPTTPTTATSHAASFRRRRSRVSIDGSMSTVRQLAEQLGATVDLCGQHEHQHLLKPANHAAMLDAWAGDAVASAKAAYIEAFNAEQAAAAELARVREASQASAAQLEEARFTLARIDEVNPTLDEYDELMAELPKIENAEALAQASDGAYWGLSGDGGAIEAVNSAIASLESLTAADAALEPWFRRSPTRPIFLKTPRTICASTATASITTRMPLNACKNAQAPCKALCAPSGRAWKTLSSVAMLPPSSSSRSTIPRA